MFAGRRTMAGTNAAHEHHARAVIVFQIVNVSLEARGIGDTNASPCARLGRDNNTGCCIAVRIERGRLSPSSDYRLFNFRPALARARRRPCGGESPAVAIVVAARPRQAILKMTLPGFSQRYCYEDAESGEYGNFHAHLLERPPLRSGLFHIL